MQKKIPSDIMKLQLSWRSSIFTQLHFKQYYNVTQNALKLRYITENMQENYHLDSVVAAILIGLFHFRQRNIIPRTYREKNWKRILIFSFHLHKQVCINDLIILIKSSFQSSWIISREGVRGVSWDTPIFQNLRYEFHKKSSTKVVCYCRIPQY